MKKNKYIKIVLLLLFCIYGKESIYAQSSVGDYVTTPIASPSMASMSKYSDAPISIQTGQPSIQVPLLELPGNAGNFSYPLGLSYNSLTKDNDRVSDVGAGWSFSAGGVIYKKVMGDLADESYNNASAPNYIKNEFDDIYYYNLPGYSGKFTIKRDTINNTFSLLKTTADNMKISYERDNTITATLKIKNFTLTDDQGYQYFFNTVNVHRYKFADEFFGAEYNSAYMLTEIKNPSGVSLISFTYEKKDKYSVNIRLYEMYRLKSLKSRKGEIILNHTYDEALEKSVNDSYNLQSLTLKNPSGETISSYVFNSETSASSAEVLKRKRILNYIEKRDKNGNKTERTSFVYNGISQLGKIISPQGAVTQYEYEQGEIFFDFNDALYLSSLEEGTSFNEKIQYMESIINNSVDTDQTSNFAFTINGDPSKRKRYVLFMNIQKQYNNPDGDFPELPTLPGTPKPIKPRNLKFILKKGSEIIRDNITNYNYDDYVFALYPGTYTLTAIFDPGVRGTGTYSVSETKFHPQPYRNSIISGNSRLKYIKSYAGINNATPQRTVEYHYDAFDKVNSASGYVFENEEGGNDTYTLYKNVKVSEAGLGSTRYTFGNPDDYPKQQTGGTSWESSYFWPYYNITKQGLMKKKEIYDEQNILLNSETYTYELDHYFNEEYDFSISSKIKSKTAYIKKTGSVSKAFYPGEGTLEAASETLIGISNLKPYYMKNTADGDVSERFLTYATAQPEYAHLVNANMTGVPVITEEKKNGKIISKTVTKYDNLSLLPTSVHSANIADGSMRATVKMDVYDHRGNPVQISSEAGKPVAFIFGYDKTQVIAKIEGATYNDAINNSLVTAAVNASNFDNVDPATENNLINALDNLRKDSSMANYQITTYTYNPLQGLTTMTSANGQREIYEYDDAGRLKTIKKAEKDAAGNTVVKKLKEYQYHYKN
ncbi:RHS repeat protein [Chryseobacterium sp. Ch-15]|uniref:RHS repeat protein n=1 Tax=Chryseobacterium muglaense TaxID=2893752 RepID=A0A9Q3UY62_9FLAO|nr:RHS repeat domain-containing protein [Chryseobacterium muglaense]MBD3907050.1 RHS repeat protein [Chryseobacterium muglaense]MCC9036552.1 RHS repeat protein [Chryseobacterium muglaense]MCM2556225.1 RHS repeat protein [Chryseobacterium muglaense]